MPLEHAQGAGGAQRETIAADFSMTAPEVALLFQVQTPSVNFTLDDFQSEVECVSALTNETRAPTSLQRSKSYSRSFGKY